MKIRHREFPKISHAIVIELYKSIGNGTRQISKDSSQMISQADRPLFVWAVALPKYDKSALNVPGKLFNLKR